MNLEYEKGNLYDNQNHRSIINFFFSFFRLQLNVFKSVETSNGTLSFNYRPTQAIGERTIYHHLLGYSTAGIVSCNLLNVHLGLFLTKFLLYN